jgi:triosephosphate isomerase
MLIVANWKAAVASRERALKLFSTAKRIRAKVKHEIVLAPPAPYLGFLASKKLGHIKLSAQDISEATGGAETGETIGALLHELGVSYVIIGHSERRARGETDNDVVEKVKRALTNGLTPIICIGERERDPDARYLQFLRSQLTPILESLSQKEILSLVIAYEPIFAIGKSAADAVSSTELSEMILYIRKILGEYLPGKGANRVRVIYGGSAEPDNARGLAGGSGVDGFLVGHASVDPAMFTALIKAVS